jgi:hypothetical protein
MPEICNHNVHCCENLRSRVILDCVADTHKDVVIIYSSVSSPELGSLKIVIHGIFMPDIPL